MAALSSNWYVQVGILRPNAATSAASPKHAPADAATSASFAPSAAGKARCARTSAPPTANISRKGPAISSAVAMLSPFPIATEKRLVHSFCGSVDDDCGAASARGPPPPEPAGVRVARDGLNAAEIQVPLLPALHRPARSLERFERPWIDAGLRLDHASLEVQPR